MVAQSSLGYFGSCSKSGAEFGTVYLEQMRENIRLCTAIYLRLWPFLFKDCGVKELLEKAEVVLLRPVAYETDAFGRSAKQVFAGLKQNKIFDCRRRCFDHSC